MSSFRRSAHRYQHVRFQDPHMRHHRKRCPGQNKLNEDQQPLFREEHPDTVSEDAASDIRAHSMEPVLSRATRFQVAIVQAGMSTRTTVNTTLHQVSERKRQLTTWISRSIDNAKIYVTTNSKRLLGFACIFMFILNIAQAAETVWSHLSSPETSKDVSPASIRVASRILQNLHPSYSMMDPCDDFEKYACGGFRMSHQLHDYQSSVSSRTLMEDDLYAKLHHLLEQDDTLFEKEDNGILVKAKSSFHACMDEERIRERGLNPLKETIGEIRTMFEGETLRLRGSSTEQHSFSMNTTARSNLTNAILQMIRLGVNPFLSMQIKADLEDPTLQSLYILPATPIGLPSAKYYQDYSLLIDYRNAIEKSLRELLNTPGDKQFHEKWPTNIDTIRNSTYGIVELESRLASIAPSDTELSDVSRYIKVTLTELDSTIPQLPVREIIRQLAPSLHDNQTIVTPTLGYLQALSNILATTPINVVHGFVIWKVVQKYAEAIDHYSLEDWKMISNALSGKKPNAREDRWLTCVRNVNTDLGWIMSKLYVERGFVDDTRDSTNEMTQGVIEAFIQIITASPWMIQEDKTKALSKLGLMGSKIGSPSHRPNIRSAAEVDAIYKTVIINNTTHFENQMQIKKAEVHREWSKLGQSTDGSRWMTAPTTVHLSYDLSTNSITIPAAIFQEPLSYEDDVPLALFYGGLSALIGHEVAHGFDNVGIQYNEAGKAMNWWSNTTKINFDERSECFREQHLQHTVGGITVNVYINDSLTLSEIIADAGGIHAAYEAWIRREAQTPSTALPGLHNFNQKQLFWLAYGNMWCSKINAATLKKKGVLDHHLLQSIRLKHTIANSHAFHEAFNCPVKEPLCEIW